VTSLDPRLQTLLVAAAVLVGASIGSFLNVVIARVPEGLSVVHPRSRCPRCQAPIAWYDNFPVLSWLFLRARCRHCALPIAARYPLVELLGAGAALLALRRHGLAPEAPAELAFAAVLLALAFIDLDTWLLPDSLTWPLLGGGLLLSALGLTPAGGILSSLGGAAAGFAAFAAVALVGSRVFKREALGFGDVWLLAGLGAWLGLGALLPVVLLASLQGTAVGLVLLVMGRLPKGDGSEVATSTSTPTPTSTETSPATPTATPTASSTPPETEGEEEDHWVPPRNAVPFGPFLALGAVEWLYLGAEIVRLVPTLRVFR